MTRRVLVTLFQDEIGPRFDLATEVLLLDLAAPDGEDDAPLKEIDRQTLILAHASGDELCELILDRGVGMVVTGGIEEEYYHYLRWKRVEVLDSVMGDLASVVERLKSGRLRPGDILYPRQTAQEANLD